MRLDMSNFTKASKKFGVGEKKKLSKPQLQSLQRVCNGLRDHLVDVCESHALYRCNLTAEGGFANILLVGANLDGDMEEVEVAINLETKEMITRGIKFSRKNDVANKMYNMIINLMDLVPFSVGLLNIPIEGRFLEGIVTGYRLEEGTYLIEIKDSLDNSYFI